MFTKYRVIECGGKFYPQRKRGLYGWKYQWHKETYLAVFDTMEGAMAFLRKLAEPRKGVNVVWQGVP